MTIRQPFRAGSFYEADHAGCRRHAEELLGACVLPSDLPSPLFGGIVPHAGWSYSGRLAAMTIRALAAEAAPATFVLFGADHWGTAQAGEVYDRGAWATPLGDVAIDEALTADLIAASDLLRANPDAHRREHSIEVQVPLVQVAAPGAKIVPIEVPPTAEAVEIGLIVGETLREMSAGAPAESSPTARVIGSTDMTHHGGHFGNFGGRGKAGVEWTRKNDRRMLDLIEAMDAEAVIGEARERRNACGAGAIAATIAACKQMGATHGICLEYADSYEITHRTFHDDPDDTTVGYASVVFA